MVSLVPGVFDEFGAVSLKIFLPSGSLYSNTIC